MLRERTGPRVPTPHTQRVPLCNGPVFGRIRSSQFKSGVGAEGVSPRCHGVRLSDRLRLRPFSRPSGDRCSGQGTPSPGSGPTRRRCGCAGLVSCVPSFDSSDDGLHDPPAAKARGGSLSAPDSRLPFATGAIKGSDPDRDPVPDGASDTKAARSHGGGWPVILGQARHLLVEPLDSPPQGVVPLGLQLDLRGVLPLRPLLLRGQNLRKSLVNCPSNSLIQLLHSFDSFTFGRAPTLQGGSAVRQPGAPRTAHPRSPEA